MTQLETIVSHPNVTHDELGKQKDLGQCGFSAHSRSDSTLMDRATKASRWRGHSFDWQLGGHQCFPDSVQQTVLGLVGSGVPSDVCLRADFSPLVPLPKHRARGRQEVEDKAEY